MYSENVLVLILECLAIVSMPERQLSGQYPSRIALVRRRPSTTCSHIALWYTEDVHRICELSRLLLVVIDGRFIDVAIGKDGAASIISRSNTS